MPHSDIAACEQVPAAAGVSGGFRWTRVSHILACLLAMTWAVAAPAEEPQWKPARLWVACSEKTVWVVGVSDPRDEALAVVRFWQASGPDDTLKLKPSRYWDISGNLVRVAAGAEALRVLYSNNATWVYFDGGREAVPGTNWREHSDAPPLAWGGDPAEQAFWALAERATGRTDDTEAAPGPAESHPAADERTEVTLPDASDRLVLIELRAGRWHRHDVPSAIETADAYWLVGHKKTAGLFWRSPDGVVRFARFAGGAWSPAETVARDVGHEEGFATAWAGARSEGPVFIVGRPGATGGRVRLHVCLPDEAAWAMSEAVREGNDYLELDAKRCGVGVRGGRIGIARPDARGGIEFGWCEVDAAEPVVRFSTLSARAPSVPAERGWMDTVLLGLLLGVLTLVIFSRREQINRPAVMPRGLVLAPVWKRAAAAAFDLMPAVFLTSACLTVFAEPLELPVDFAAMKERMDDPEFLAKLLPFHALLLLAYGIWCVAWELACGTTLGKRIFGCRVLSADGTVAAPRQIVIRNVLRVIMFAFGPQGLTVALMMMVFLTRNRQRLGDLLANTVVVEPGPPNGKP